MDELIARVLRTVACVPRLRILSRLGGGEELTVKRLASDLGVRPDLACIHLARLAAVGLVKRRRSGRKCYCAAGSPYGPGTLSGEVAAWLGTALPSEGSPPRRALPSGSRKRPGADGLPQVYRVVFDAATAFTHPRRIQILRRLSSSTPAPAREFTSELRMSGPALNRHLAKLIRRQYISPSREGKEVSYRLAPAPKTPYHALLMEIVQRHWGERDGRA
ncbi:MAG: helix-turn-helix transcriptional regulator [Planctomycetes bacterium]|nr:helix-turn-helix transcriptional regulator [Planctomycetota bacterium]